MYSNSLFLLASTIILLYWFSWKAKRMRDLQSTNLTPQIPATIRGMPGESPKPGTQISLSSEDRDPITWTCTCRLLEHTLAGHWNQEQSWGSNPGIPIWDADVPSSILNSCTKYSPNTIILEMYLKKKWDTEKLI